MAIQLEEQRSAGLSVLKPRNIGDRFRGAVVKTAKRDVLKDGKPVLKDGTGKPRQELVVTLMTIKSTMEAGLGEESAVPAPGDLVREIHKGGAYASWIEATRSHRTLQVGDIYERSIDEAHVYDMNGEKKASYTAQADVVAFRSAKAEGRKSGNLGFRGAMLLRSPTTDEAEWVQRAEEAYLNDRPVVARADVPDLEAF